MAEFGLRVAMVDAYQRPVSRTYTVEAIDHATALAAAGTFMSDLANITEARILWYTIADETVYSDAVTAGANRDEGATMVVRKADNKLATFNVPAPINAIFDADGTVDLTDTAVTALMAHFLSGVFRVSDHEVVAELVSGRLDA